MRNLFYLKLQLFLDRAPLLIGTLLFIFCPSLWAVQEAIVTADRAVIYADQEMTAPVGYVSRGKKIKVGENAKNKAQVYPIIVSGKVGYIQLRDINTQSEGLDGPNLLAERFQRNTKGEDVKTSFSIAHLTYNSQILLATTNGGIDDKDSLQWTGVSLRGSGIVNNRWELQIITNYLTAQAEEEQFKMLETGLGGGFRFFDYRSLALRLETQLLVVPWSSYAHGTNFRVNGQGYSAGAGLSLTWGLSKHWGLDAYSGVYYTTLSGFSVPRPFASIEPIFYGTRLGLGIHYIF